MDSSTTKTELERVVKKFSQSLEEFQFQTIYPSEARILMEHFEEIEPFHDVKCLQTDILSSDDPWQDLHFLGLFPSIRELEINNSVRCIRAKAKRMTFDGIQTCFQLEKVRLSGTMVPVLSGIEFCSKLEIFTMVVTCEDDRPMDITPLSELPCLNSIQCYVKNGDECALVETEGLDLSRCKSLKYLHIRSTSKDFRFLGGIQLENLCVHYSGIESLDGLDTTNLTWLDLSNNQITCVEKLMGIKVVFNAIRPPQIYGNPIDPKVLKRLYISWGLGDRA